MTPSPRLPQPGGRLGRADEGAFPALTFLGLLGLSLFACGDPSHCVHKSWPTRGSSPRVGLSCNSRALPVPVGGRGQHHVGVESMQWWPLESDCLVLILALPLVRCVSWDKHLSHPVFHFGFSARQVIAASPSPGSWAEEGSCRV